MYAIVDIAGQQFKVAKDTVVTSNRLNGEIGSQMEFDHILLLSSEDGVKIGTPYIDGAKVKAVVVAHDRGDRVLVFKKNRRKKYRVLNGHRQYQTQLKIEEIVI